MESMRASHEAAGDLCVFADLYETFGAAFGGVRRLFRPLIDTLLSQTPSSVVAYGPEVLALWPELRAKSELADVPRIDEIALGGTKRRLHKDSEKVFRIIHALTSLLQGLTDVYATQRRQVVLVFDHLESADRLTLCVLYHVLQRCVGSSALRLIGAYAPSGARWLWGCYQPGTDHLVAASGRHEHARIVALITEHDRWSKRLINDGEPSVASWESLVREPPHWLRLASLGIPVADAPIQTSFIPHSVLERVRVLIPIEARIKAHRAAADELRLRDSDDESVLAEQAFHEIHSLQLDRAGNTVVRALEASFGFAFNFEVLLLCASEFLVAAHDTPSLAGSVTAVDLYVALVECYLEKYPRALALFADIDARLDNAVLRAQIHFYRGLIEAKCLGNLKGAGQVLNAGLMLVDSVRADSWPAALEYGWLSNAYAFTLWKSRLPAKASEVVTQALDVIEPFETASPQILNLKINLLNNLSVLHETSGDFEVAREVWEQLGPLRDVIPGGRFEKSFLYRRGWLFLQAGDRESAYRDYVDSYKVAARYRDEFHMDIISSACGYISAVLEQHGNARYWYALNLDLRLTLNDRPGACAALIAMATVSHLEGDDAAAVAHLERALGYASTNSQADRLRSLRQSTRFWSDELTIGSLTPPRMKLSTPFSIGHLVSARAFRQSTHVSLASASIAL